MKTRYMLIVALTLLMAACKGNTENTEQTEEQAKEANTETVTLTERQLKTVGITLGPLEQRSLGEAVRANGELRLNPQDRASVVPLVGGVVRRVLVKEGDHVAKGQTVAYIESTEIVALQRDYLTATRELAGAEQELQRQQLLRNENAGVEKNYRAAQANVSVCQARVEGLRQQLAQLGVSAGVDTSQRQVAVASPISGTVTRVLTTTGGYADAQSPLMELSNNALVYAQLNVFEKDLPRVSEGQRVDIALTYQQDTHISGTVASVQRTIDTDTRSASVHVTLDASQTSGRRLGEGMTVTGMISTGRAQVDALPDEAIVAMDGKKYVFVLEHTATDNGQKTYTFRRVEVVEGQSELGHTAITFPVPPKAGAQFVRAGAFYIASAASDHGEED